MTTTAVAPYDGTAPLELGPIRGATFDSPGEPILPGPMAPDMLRRSFLDALDRVLP